jgi:hypothetical protein
MKIFIPRILSSLSKEFVIDAFKRLSIGDITNIEFRSKSTIYRNVSHGFAFITLNLFCSPIGNKLRLNLENAKSTRVYYDSSSTFAYWELKPYFETRNISNVCYPVLTISTIKNAAIREENDFDELAQEIQVERQSYYSHWQPSCYATDLRLVI